MWTTHKEIQSVDLPPEQVREMLNMLDSVPADAGRSQRRSRRLRYRSFQVVVDVLDHRQQVDVSFRVPTRNISAHGLSFIHRQMLAPGQLVMLTIPMLDGQSLRTMGRVARCRHLSGMLHEIGVEFVTGAKGQRIVATRQGRA